MKRPLLLGITFVIAQTLFASSYVYASTILQAVHISVNEPDDLDGTFYPADNLINQSGLSANYISGVTDFNAFTATTTVDSSIGVGGQAGIPQPSAPINFDIDMGSLVTIDAIALWTQGTGAASINTFDLIVSNASDFSAATTLGSFTMVNTDLPALANIFTFTAIQTQFIRLSATSNLGYPIATRFNEFAARSAVPLPAAVWLFGSGLLGLVGIARRKKA